jgi:hypothetical protein
MKEEEELDPFACIQKPNLSESQKHRQQKLFFELQSQVHFRKKKKKKKKLYNLLENLKLFFFFFLKFLKG